MTSTSPWARSTRTSSSSATFRNAETRHLEAVRTLLERYGVADPTAGEAAGTFSDARFQDLYSQADRRSQHPQAALDAGVKVEQTDIADLGGCPRFGDFAPDVTQVYDALISGSQRHLAAFSRWGVISAGARRRRHNHVRIDACQGPREASTTVGRANME